MRKKSITNTASLGVRETANKLGVRESTLRRWEEQGYICAVQLPSGARQFRPDDVDNLRKRIFDDQLPVGTGEKLYPTKARPID